MQKKPKPKAKVAVAFRLDPLDIAYYKRQAREASMSLTGLIRAGLKAVAPKGGGK